MGADLPTISQELAKALSNPTTSRILIELAVRPMSPSQYVEEVGGGLPTIYRAFKRLEGWGFVELVGTKTGGARRGGTEHIYRRTGRTRIDTPDWELLPLLARSDFSGTILSSYFARVTEALAAGTFDAERDRHLSFDMVTLDRQAWLEVGEKLDALLDSLKRFESESKQRLADGEGEEILTTVGLAQFRSPDRDQLAAARAARETE
jgi:DNA-binding transcriptional ArsR family regulator